MKKALKYRDVMLYKGAIWWVQYWYRIPDDLLHLYDNKPWKKFVVKEDINRYKTEEYAETLLKAVEHNLKEGYDPFVRVREALAAAQTKIKPSKKWTIIQGLNYFKTTWERRGNEESTTRVYVAAAQTLSDWLTARKFQNEPAAAIQKNHVEQCFQESYETIPWSNRTFNNNIDRISTAFNFLLEEKIIAENPCLKIHRKQSISKKHRYFEPEIFDKVRKLMDANDLMLKFAAKLVYYLCLRSDKELKFFKIGNIYPDRRQVLIQAEESKTDADRFVDIPDDLLPELTALKKKFPAEFYVIGAKKGNLFISENRPGPEPFGKGFVSNRFAKIRKLAGLHSDYTLYGFKHTRIIHLKQDSGINGNRVTDSDLMKLTGHTSYEAFAKYLRDLGVDGNPESINRITRKF